MILLNTCHKINYQKFLNAFKLKEFFYWLSHLIFITNNITVKWWNWDILSVDSTPYVLCTPQWIGKTPWKPWWYCQCALQSWLNPHTDPLTFQGLQGYCLHSGFLQLAFQFHQWQGIRVWMVSPNPSHKMEKLFIQH